ncbi:MAG: hypothetical protein IT323_12780 [Anaerolineae bacterium]|nr:hypothetical protein [Anaerolineae bacterium]
MNTVILLLRILHVVGGVFWVGSAILYFYFVAPSVKGLGPARPQFLQGFIERRRYPMFMNISSAVTILAGALLYWNSSGGLQTAWIQTPTGIGFTIGSVAAILAYLLGFILIRPRGQRLGQLGKEIAMAGGPPPATLAAEMHVLDDEIMALERVELVLMIVSLLTMATARYWGM